MASLFPAVERQTFGGCLAPVAALEMELSAVPTLPYPVLAPSLFKSLMYGFSAASKSYKQPSTEKRQLRLHVLNTILKSCYFFFTWLYNVSLPWFMLFKRADLHTFPVIVFSKLKKCADWCEVLSDNSSMLKCCLGVITRPPLHGSWYSALAIDPFWKFCISLSSVFLM